MSKVFINDLNFGGLYSLENINLIIIINLEFTIPSNGTANNNIYCSFRGKYLRQVSLETIKTSSEVDLFVYDTDNNNNYIMISVPKDINNSEEAKKYIRGMLVEYQIADLVPVGSCKDPLYEVSTYLLDGTLVSTTVACNMPDIVRKIQALEANLDINEQGYYKHVVRLALTQK